MNRKGLLGSELIAINGCKMPTECRQDDDIERHHLGFAVVGKKHQIIVDAQVYGEGQEKKILQPITEAIKERYQ